MLKHIPIANITRPTPKNKLKGLAAIAKRRAPIITVITTIIQEINLSKRIALCRYGGNDIIVINLLSCLVILPPENMLP